MKKILVVDDIEDNVKLLQYDLEDDGYKVVVARDGIEAIEVAKTESPDLILLDIMMPRMDGIEACRILKEHHDLKETPVLMLSAKDQDEDVISGLDAGATDYLFKPINYSIVAARIRTAIRAGELTKRLQEEKRRAEEALRARTVFLAMMSHEIRTPITAILGLADILVGDDAMSPFDKEQAAKMVYANSRHLLGVVNNILDYSKAESGNLEVEQIRCSIFEILRDVGSVVELKAQEQGLLLLVDYEYPLPRFIDSDPTRLKQVLINLITNAIKFTKVGSVRVQVSFVEEDKRISIRVRDTGIGMSEDELEKLFVPFQQANTSINRKYGGTGLGLSIVSEIVEKLGGTIEVESKVGEGSLFHITFPAVVTSQLVMTEDNPTLSKVTTRPQSNSYSGTVLLVEDDAVNSSLLTHLLEKVGVQVVTAFCGETGVSKALENQFSLILMDMHLPGMNGVAAVEQLRAHSLTTPIIALTASDSLENIEKLLSVGCQEYIPKPFEKEQLYECLARYLSSPEEELVVSEVEGGETQHNESFAKVIVDYVDSLEGHLHALENSFQERNWEELRVGAHHLAGAGLFGFPQIALVSKLLEERATAKNEEVCADILNRLKGVIGQVVHAEKSL